MRYKPNILLKVLQSILGQENALNLVRSYYRVRVSTQNFTVSDKYFKRQAFDWSSLKFIYISQPPRQGGTLMRSLFDEVENVYMYPHELSIEPNLEGWKDTAISNKDRVDFYKIRDSWIDYYLIKGMAGRPFDFNPVLQEKLFLKSNTLSKNPIRRYIESFYYAHNPNELAFNRNLFVAFTPWNLDSIDEIKRFYTIAPSGIRIQIVRDLEGWWNSESNYDKRDKDISKLFKTRWLKPIRVGIKAKQELGNRYLIIRFKDLINDRERIMKSISETIKFEFSKNMLTPTIFGFPLKANSSYKYGEYFDNTNKIPDDIRYIANDLLKEMEDKQIFTQ